MSAAQQAAALDAADGVMDGKCFGRPIVQGGAAPAFGGAYPATFAGAAPVAGYGGFAGAYPATFAGAGYPGAFAGAGYPATFAGAGFGASNAALALDAADGVIDGKSFGRPIVQAGAASMVPYTGVAAPVAGYGAGLGYGAYPAAGYGLGYGAVSAASYAPFAGAGGYYGGASVVRAAPVAGYGGFAGAYPATFAGAGYPATFAGAGYPTATYGGANTAAALDAADGVIDGKHFGRPIVRA
eukprot:NODE_1449_length_857_cov_142.379452_g1332_i1.p1 GENE.NODE_1449_length_857_cov_142.379452_g1332_i1~~NODE_1449_length_857_cov_142.379452_g1332_i1.p1  ORF type:complete len:269 (-),score=123.99 NODE_1449_length_857_cov_142.379452_g1332_i1:50-772(-)